MLQGESVFFVMTNLIVTPNQRQATCPEVGRTEPLDPQTPGNLGVRTDRGHFWSNKERKDERQVFFPVVLLSWEIAVNLGASAVLVSRGTDHVEPS